MRVTKVSFSIKPSYSFLQLCSLLSLEHVTNFEHVMQSLFNTYIFGSYSHITMHLPLKYQYKLDSLTLTFIEH